MPPQSSPGGPVLAPPVPTDSACRSLTITLVGNNNVTVSFPDRAACTSGLIPIRAGSPTRSGGAKLTVNIPLRLLNRTAYSALSPTTTSLSPSNRFVLAPSGEPPSKIVPQNADSVRPGTSAWVWLVGSAGTVPQNDSTGVRTLSIRLESPVTIGQVLFATEAALQTTLGWPVLVSDLPVFDTTKLVQQPGTSIVMFRTAAALRFTNGVSDAAKQAFFAQNGLTVLGVTRTGLFFVGFTDPGNSFSQYEAFLSVLRAKPEVVVVMPAYRSGLNPSPDS